MLKFASINALLTAIPANIYWLDNQNVYQGCNLAQALDFGLQSPEEVIGKRNCDLPIFNNKLEFSNKIDKVNLKIMKSKSPAILEEKCFKDGQHKIYLSFKSPLFDSNNRVSGLLGVSIDITNLKMKEERLIQENEQIQITLKNILENLPGHVYWKNMNGQFLGCNLLQAKSAGFSSIEELIGKADDEMPWKDQADLYRKNDLEVMIKGVSVITEEKATLKDGEVHTFLSNKVPFRDSKSKIIGVLGISLDITAQKNMQESLRDENIHIKIALENILNNLPGHVYWKDLNGRFLGCNMLQAESAGFSSPEEMIGKSDYEMPWKKQASEYRQNDLKVIETGVSIVTEEESTLEDGKTRIFLANKVPLRGENDEILGVLGISLDITEQKKTQKALRKAEDQADGMSLVSAAMAHELRTPLAGIAMGAKGIEKYLHTLLEAYQLAQASHLPVKSIASEQIDILSEVLANIKNEANQANMVIDMLLANLSVRKNKKKQRQTIKLSIADYITKALNRYVFPPGKRQIVHIDLSRNFMFYGDETLFSHIVFNLLKNSFYFIDKMRKGEIYIWLESNEDYNELHFKDTAQGIREEDLPHIFEQFFTKGTHHGTGIGLAFCKAVMGSWGGTIICRSVYGEYVEFICKFPKKLHVNE